MSRPEPATIEIVERVPAPDQPAADAATRGYIRPTEIRLNGVPLAMPRDEPITVHGLTLSADELVQVTLTVFARRVLIGAEPTDGVDDDPEPNLDVSSVRRRDDALSDAYGLDVYLDPTCPPGTAYLIAHDRAFLQAALDDEDDPDDAATSLPTAVAVITADVTTAVGRDQ